MTETAKLGFPLAGPLTEWRYTVTRTGDEVHLSWRQLVGILMTIVVAGMGAAGVPAKFLFDQNQRIAVTETIVAAHQRAIDATQQRVATIEARDAILGRIEQHLGDIDRQLIEIKANQK